ncbi:MAG TPA: N-methyl-L-tryptophan oxidase [Gemmatimonadales bacterium]|nr:N-methyl-L-tryptophan oxidase [Gemmatimonadales bacterium]
MPYDIILAGLGAVGSSTAVHLSGRGLRVLGLDRFHPPHTMGSSHGGSRVIRETAFEHPRYVPLARRAYENWRRLEAATGTSLLHVTGVLYVGPESEGIVGGTLASARQHGIKHEILDAAAIARRYPQLHELNGAIGVFEPSAGWLDPEGAVAAALTYASTRGIELQFDEPVTRWEAAGEGVRVTTTRGTYEAQRLLLAAGAWMPQLLGAAGRGLTVERQVQHWFEPVSPAAATLPVFIRQTEEAVCYGLPPAARADGAIKIAVHHDGDPTTADTVRREVSPEEVAATRLLLERYVPALAGPHRGSVVCLYTNSTDGQFVIDRHPDHPSVVLASPCSGFGFKFASVVGEILAGLLLDEGVGDFDLAPFQVGRLSRGPG